MQNAANMMPPGSFVAFCMTVVLFAAKRNGRWAFVMFCMAADHRELDM
jgi:hypothetical protein